MCNIWYHIKCGGVTPTQYKNLQLQTTAMIDWLCLECIDTLSNLSFANISNLEDEFNTTDVLHNSSCSSTISIEDPLQAMLELKQRHHNQEVSVTS